MGMSSIVNIKGQEMTVRQFVEQYIDPQGLIEASDDPAGLIRMLEDAGFDLTDNERQAVHTYIQALRDGEDEDEE